MLKKLIGVLFLVAGSFISIHAQNYSSDSIPVLQDIFSLLQDDSYGGTMNFYQNPSLHVLVDKNTRIHEKNGMDGYRIQIYSGSGISARIAASDVGEKFKEYFPDFDGDLIHYDYRAPYFKVSVGDFRSKNEAYEYYHTIMKKFPGSYIVKSKINFPKLELSENK